MAHEKQREFFRKVKSMHPQFFTDVKVLDIGSLDINGSNRHAFEHPYSYIGVDLSEGKNVDVICPGHLYESGYQFDTVISSECFEHDMYYARTLQNMVKLTRPGGLLLFTCASTGRPEHGTKRSNPQDSPFTSLIENDYYMNLTEQDVREEIDMENHFSQHEFVARETWPQDLYFWGIKK